MVDCGTQNQIMQGLGALSKVFRFVFLSEECKQEIDVTELTL